MNKINCKKHGIVFFETDRYGCLWCKIEKLEAENKKLREYMQHKWECKKNMVKNPCDPLKKWKSYKKCTCGFDNLLKDK